MPEFRACQTCPSRLDAEHEADRGVCRTCEQRIGSQLAEVARCWARLSAYRLKGTPAKGAEDAPGPSGPSGSQPPGNLDVLHLLAGAATEPLLVEEDAWRRELCNQGYNYPPTPRRGDQDRTMSGVLEFLTSHLYWACHDYPDVDDLDKALRALLGTMRGVITGDKRRRMPLPIQCPLPARGHDEDDRDAPPCGGALAFDPRRTPQVIRCDTCLRSIPHTRWHRLGIHAGLLSAPQPDAA